METLQLQRSAQRAFDIRGWLNAKSDSFSLLMGETVTRMQVIFYAPVKKTVNFFGNPEIYSNFAALKLNRGMMPHSLIGVRLLYPILRILGINEILRRVGKWKHSRSFAIKALATRSAVFFMLKKIVMNELFMTQRSAQRAFDIKGWLNAKSDSFSLLMGETVTRMQVLLVHLAGLFILLTAVLVNFSLLLSVVSAFVAAWMVATLNRKGGEA